jgi:hypothetical protein
MDFKINVFSFNGDELSPCSIDKARELCEKNKAELLEGGTAIRMLGVSPRDVSVLRVKQLTHLLTVKNISEHKLHQVRLSGTMYSGKSHAILHAIKALSGMYIDSVKVSNIVILYDSQSNLKTFTSHLETLYRVAAGNSHLSLDYESAHDIYYVNRNDVFNGHTIPVKTNLLRFVPICTDSFTAYTNTSALSARTNLLSGPYVVLSDDIRVEPTSDTYKAFIDKAQFVMTTTTVESLEEVELNTSYK